MIAVIVPFSRPRMAENVRENYLLQRRPAPTVLVVVENGPALGSWGGGDPMCHVVQSAHGRSHARTAGLRKARELGASHYAYWDDDDHYAPGFLEHMWQHRELADVIGLCSYVEQDPTGKRWLIGADQQEGPRLPEFPGAFLGGVATPTLFGRVDRALDWEADVPMAEELFWHREMALAGRTLYGIREPNPLDPLYRYVKHADPNHGHAIQDWRREIKACNGVALAS
jgi:hypothetical protein